MPRRLLPRIPSLTITALADRGRGIGRDAEGKVYFVQDAAPGDVVDIQVIRQKKGYAEGIVTRWQEKSADRTEPFCPHFEHCGGCSYQHVRYARQLVEKQQWVRDAFQRIGHSGLGVELPIIGAESDRHYRNKLEFAFSSRRWLTRQELEDGRSNEDRVLGFHPRKAFDKVLDLQTCFLQPEPSEKIRKTCLELGRSQALSFYDVKRHQGFLRQLVIRVFTTGQVLVVVGFGEEDARKRERYLHALQEQVPEITSLHYFVNTKWNDFFLDLPVHHWAGTPKVEEVLGHVRYAIGPKSFFQTNTRQAARLYEEVRTFAGLQGTERVYDLYAGLGSIALFVAGQCREVIGIEEVAPAVEDARENALLNGVDNARFHAGDVRKLMDDTFIREHGPPDVLITDPPRAGMHEDVVAGIRKMAPKRIVYVSCNPASQARDIQGLGEAYRVTRSRAVDMFPHTHHVENIALLERV